LIVYSPYCFERGEVEEIKKVNKSPFPRGIEGDI
jgi:hypothetical protein